MRWIYLSPHLDDAALSCGGLIWEQTQSGTSVEVWTVCAGDAPGGELSTYAGQLHERWKVSPTEAVAIRRKEDVSSLASLGAVVRHLAFMDAIYRKHAKTGEWLYVSEWDLFGGLQPGDEAMVHLITMELGKLLPADAALVVPLTLGNHVDHLLVRTAAEQLGRKLMYYADYPYAFIFAEAIPSMLPVGYEQRVYPVSEKGLNAWQDSVAAHSSQISTFWGGEQEMRTAIKTYSQNMGGVLIWEKRL